MQNISTLFELFIDNLNFQIVLVVFSVYEKKYSLRQNA